MLVLGWLAVATAGCATPVGSPAAGTLALAPAIGRGQSESGPVVGGRITSLIDDQFGPSDAERDQRAAEGLQEATAVYQQASAAQGSARRSAFAKAAGAFARAAKSARDASLQEKALFMKAESHFFADEYKQARNAYDDLLKRFPNSRHLDAVSQRRFAIARFWAEHHKANPRVAVSPVLFNNQLPRFDTLGNAVKVFDGIRLDDPTGALADDATLAAGNAHFEAGNYDDADRFYSDLRETFYDSEHQYLAHLLGVKCKLLLYRGPDYDGKVLDDAEELIEKIRRSFPERAGEDANVIETAWRDLRAKQAQREWTRANYYERRRQFGAARMYYHGILKDYPTSNLADRARQRLAAIGDEPDQPPQRLVWLVDLFDKIEDERTVVAEVQDWMRRR